MQAEIRMKMSYDSRAISLGEKPYINVLPNHPFEAYRRLDQETVIQVKKTERVPLPQIRQLILLFTLPEHPNAPLEQSDLLRQKLILSNLNSQNQELHDMSERWMMQSQRLSKLNDVFEEYNQQRQMLISRAVMKTKHNVHESAQKFKQSVKLIQTEKNTKINAFYNRINGSRSGHRNGNNQNYQMGSSTRLQPHEQDEVKNIEKEANMKTVEHIKSQAQENNKYQSQQQDRLYGLRHLSCYLNEFEKALIFIVSARNISNLNEQLSTINQNYNKTFSQKLHHYVTELKRFNDMLLNHIFQWHMHIKHNKSYDARIDEFRMRSQNLQKELAQQLYYFIPKILANLEKDREQMRQLVSFFTNNFESYLGTYYSIKEVEMYHSKQSHVEQIIQNQRQSLNNHLKKNFGMMVPFKKSHEYEELAGIAISKDKPYLKTLLQQKIGYLEQAIAYINYQHAKLYKQACENSPGVSNKIRRKLEEFQMMGSKYPQLRVHLEQSCQRLLQIVNH